MRKSMIVISFMAICALSAYVLWTPFAHTHDETEEEHHHEFVTFTEEQCREHSIEKRVASSGILKLIVRSPAKIVIAADQIAHVLPKISGITLKAQKNLGEKVAANELLAIIESKEMAEAKAGYLAALKKELLKANTYERESSLHAKKISAAQDFYEAKNGWEEAQIELELTRQKLFALGLSSEELDLLPQEAPSKLSQYELRSPISGSVISRHMTTGELVNPEHEAYVIADLSKVWAEINIFSKDRYQVKQGQTVTISTHQDHAALATIVFLSPVIDEDTRTSSAIAMLDNHSGEWVPGTFAQAELITEEIPVGVIVPKDAIQNIEGQNALFVAAENGFAVRFVTLGRTDEAQYEVIAGIEPGEQYACKNTFLLKADLQKEEAEHMD